MTNAERQFKELMMKRTSKKLHTGIQYLTFPQIVTTIGGTHISATGNTYIVTTDSSLTELGVFNALKDAIEEYNGYIASKQGHKLICPTHYIECAMDTCKGCRWYDICTTGIGRVK